MTEENKSWPLLATLCNPKSKKTKQKKQHMITCLLHPSCAEVWPCYFCFVNITSLWFTAPSLHPLSNSVNHPLGITCWSREVDGVTFQDSENVAECQFVYMNKRKKKMQIQSPWWVNTMPLINNLLFQHVKYSVFICWIWIINIKHCLILYGRGWNRTFLEH